MPSRPCHTKNALVLRTGPSQAKVRRPLPSSQGCCWRSCCHRAGSSAGFRDLTFCRCVNTMDMSAVLRMIACATSYRPACFTYIVYLDAHGPCRDCCHCIKLLLRGCFISFQDRFVQVSSDKGQIFRLLKGETIIYPRSAKLRSAKLTAQSRLFQASRPWKLPRSGGVLIGFAGVSQRYCTERSEFPAAPTSFATRIVVASH